MLHLSEVVDLRVAYMVDGVMGRTSLTSRMALLEVQDSFACRSYQEGVTTCLAG